MLGPAMPSHRPQNLEFDILLEAKLKAPLVNVTRFESTNGNSKLSSFCQKTFKILTFT